MLFDFENLNNESVSDVGAENITQEISDLFEDSSDWLQEGTSLPENMYAFLENLNKEYLYEKTELSSGIVKESVTWRADSDIVRNIDSIYNLDRAKDVWHIGDDNSNSLVCCQEFIVEEYLGEEAGAFSENRSETDWIYELNDDVYLENAGALLEYYGIETHAEYEANFKTLENALDAGNRVIVYVNSLCFDSSYNGIYPMWNANHTVEIIGVDRDTDNSIKIIINDPGVEDGCGKTIDYDTFMNAWDMSDNFMLIAERTEE